MQSVLVWSSCLLVILSHCPFLNGAPYLSHCPNSSLEINGGSYTLSDFYNDGSILRYKCPVGFYPYPAKKRECDSGHWEPKPGRKIAECKKVTCPNPKVMENGEVSPYKSEYTVNDTTTYKCHSGYTFRGSATRVCQVNGKWSGSTPICSVNTDHCPDPGIPPGTNRDGHIFNIDDKVTYSCHNRLKLIGSKVRVCLDGGQWSGREPECYADFTYDSPEEVAESFGNSLKTTLNIHEESVSGPTGRIIHLDQKGKLDIYIALDASDSIDEDSFNKAKNVIKKLIKKISYYEISPNYEIIIFATDVTHIVRISDYKRGKETKLQDILNLLDGYGYDDKGQKSGTNIRNAYKAILDSISFEKAQNKKDFDETQHVIIMFTDGIANMGGNPKPVVEEIKQTVFDGDTKRDSFLDLYAFGVGADIEKEKIGEWVTERNNNEKHYFLLPDIKQVSETLDKMIDESTSVSLCGLYQDYVSEENPAMRPTYPWMITIFITHDDGKTTNCVGSLITPKFILTAAHCFRFDEPEKILLVAPNLRVDIKFEVDEYIPHEKYNITNRKAEGVENYDYDVALIKLKKNVQISSKLRTICVPCTQEANRALQLSDIGATCEKHRELLLNSDLVPAYFMRRDVEKLELNNEKAKINVHIRQGREKDICIKQTQTFLDIEEQKAKEVISDNFLCTGGPTGNYIDDLTCKGDSGGPVFVERSRLFQVGIISWGLDDVCVEDKDHEKPRDFHTNLFSPKVQEFLEDNIDDDEIHFL